MQFEKGHIYHIYNQGNNRQQIFFSRENYLFFLKKMKEYILPFGDIMAWRLMPNHFHWLVYIRETEIQAITHGETESHPASYCRNINSSIAILLRSYTRAINKQEDRSGSLFREATKSECVTKRDGITPSFYNTGFGTIINSPNQEKEYPQICFNYIHENPVRAGLVKNNEAWEFSSCQDIAGIRNGNLMNQDRINEFHLHL